MYKDSYCYAERVRRMTDGIHNIAVIDLGSNSLRMSVNAVMPDGKWKILLKLRETVRLGEGMSDGCLRAESVERVVRALEQYRLAAASAGCDEMIATATQAVRIAKNRRDFLDAAKARADIDFRILTGEEEARYSFLAVKETLPIDDGLIFDTGGGSTEIMLVKNRELVRSVSTPCGAVMMTDRFRGRSQEEMYSHIYSEIKAIPWIEEARGLTVYGVGGSARTLGQLYKKRQLKADELNGLEIKRGTVAALYRNIYDTAPEERADIEGMDKSRADVILAGLTPLEAMMDMLDSPRLVLCAYGVKEGVFFERKNEIIKGRPKLNLVLVEPEIPQNTGNIARTCAAAGLGLHLVRPLGFDISDKALKRAGLDYWDMVDVRCYDGLEDFFAKTAGGRYFYATTKGGRPYTEAEFSEGDYILFGKETRGLPEELLKKDPDRCIRIPMAAGARSLNLGNSAAIIAYEALRQNDFFGLKQKSDYLEE